MFRYALARIFSVILFAFLSILGWKRSTVYANYRLAKGWNSSLNDPASGGKFTGRFWRFYYKLLWNLCRHGGELLFCFSLFKELPRELEAYPCCRGGLKFEIDESSVAVVDEMRKGGIFLTAHYGNYEAMGPWFCCLGIPLAASYIPVKPMWLNRILENRIRAVGGKTYSVNAKSPREFLRLLADGRLFCLLSDQDSRIQSAEAGEFMGHAVHNNPVPGFLLKHRPETPVYICWIEEPDSRTKRLHAQRLSTCAPIAPEVAAPAAPVVMQHYNAWLESRIAEEPALWYGFTHRRFYSVLPDIYK
jgi:KDO2-lipid IV(A) lauroyltransferase